MSGQDKPLDNNSFWRGVSDKLDQALGTSYDNPKESKIRGTLHGAYHAAMGYKNDNPREFARAKDQWNSAWGGATDNLKKHDEQNKK